MLSSFRSTSIEPMNGLDDVELFSPGQLFQSLFLFLRSSRIASFLALLLKVPFPPALQKMLSSSCQALP